MNGATSLAVDAAADDEAGTMREGAIGARGNVATRVRARRGRRRGGEGRRGEAIGSRRARAVKAQTEEDPSARIDVRASAEDRVRKAKAYAAELAKARAEANGGASGSSEEGGDGKADAGARDASANRKPPTPPSKREISVQILTRDQDYNPFDEDEEAVGFEMEDAVYKPKVSTWGVFERPPDISKTYGGGRTIKREELEDEEAIAERKTRVAKKLAKYREDQGKTLTNAEFEEVKELLRTSDEAIRQGYMQAALDMLEPWALERIGPKTELGGRLIFNYAVCLDNLQRRDEALKQYRRCIGNQYGNVSKQADRMVWGMTTASKKMKADLFDYMDSAKLDAYDEYLIKMANEKFAGEIDEEEVRELNNQAIATLAVLFGTPLLFFAYISSSH